MGGMPKVSQEHLDRRRQQILDAAKECFAKDGFHNTSMQDIFKASGLSAGAVYRYFPSKHSLIRAIAEQALNSALIPLRPDGDDQPGDIADIVTGIMARFSDGGPLAATRPITVQVWAEAFRDPELKAIGRDVLGKFAGRIEQMLPPGMPPEVARLVLATLQGLVVQSGIFDDFTLEMVGAAARAAFVSARRDPADGALARLARPPVSRVTLRRKPPAG
jgi:AcrR family transcriptional regulator